MAKVAILKFDSEWMLTCKAEGRDTVNDFINLVLEKQISIEHIIDEIQFKQIDNCELKVIFPTFDNENYIAQFLGECITAFKSKEPKSSITFEFVSENSDDIDDKKPNEKELPKPSEIKALLDDIFEKDMAKAKKEDDLIDIEDFDDDELLEVDTDDTESITKDEGSLPFDNKKRFEDDNRFEAYNLLTQIKKLVGAEEFKALCERCFSAAEMFKEFDVIDTFTRRCYLFSINDGCGLSTYTSLFGKLMVSLGLINRASLRYVAEYRIPADTGDKNFDPFSQARHILLRSGAGSCNVILFDICEWMTMTKDKRFRDFLSFIEDHQTNKIILFRVPFVEKEILTDIMRNIGDILTVNSVSFPPFDQKQIIAFAKRTLCDYGFSMQGKAAWDIFLARVTEEKNDGRFYGTNTINKIVREMIYEKTLRNSKTGNTNQVITRYDMANISKTYHSKAVTGLDILDNMVGMEKVKLRLQEIVAQIEMAQKNPALAAPCIHMRFVGNPGTGKTTVARVIGQIFKEKGILRNGNFFEVMGRDLCGQYIGSTAPKTAAICRDAYGSVLFIDEAYSLYKGERVHDRDFGKEAIDTLIAEMENHRSDFVVIMAGYTDEMKTLMEANTGLESRMPYVIEFPNYTRKQLAEIFMDMTKKSIKYTDDLSDAVCEYFDSIPDEIINSKKFSNARFVRNLFERTCGKAAMRVQLNKCEYRLSREDFLAATNEREFTNIMEKRDKGARLGF